MRKGLWLVIWVSAELAFSAFRVFALDTAAGSTRDAGLFARTNLVAWCIVPFDAKKRGPEERAAMLEKLGFQLLDRKSVV